MCTELFLAIIYFSTIIFVNFLLYQLINNYWKNIIYLLKIKNIFKFFNKKNNQLFLFLYAYSKEESKKNLFLKDLAKLLKIQDILLIGNLLKYFAIFLKNKNFSENLYFLLLENQYLFKNNFIK